jgi:hypothetical protein
MDTALACTAFAVAAAAAAATVYMVIVNIQERWYDLMLYPAITMLISVWMVVLGIGTL